MRAPDVRLYRNPWSEILSGAQVLQILMTAASKAYEAMEDLHKKEELSSEKQSFGMVILDPTRPRQAIDLADRLLAAIAFGPDGGRLLVNGLAKADAHERHGWRNGWLVNCASHCLANSDFAYGNSVEYLETIAGGSGFSQEQDGDVTLLALQHFVDSVRERRDAWLIEQRQAGRKQAWFSNNNRPGIEYVRVLSVTSYHTTT